VRWYCVAAEQALEGNDLPGVIARVDRAVGLGASGEALGQIALTRALAHNWRGEHKEAEPWAEEAIAVLPEGTARWCAAMGELVWSLGTRSDGAGVAHLVERLLVSRTGGEALGSHTIALSHAADWLLHIGEYDNARSAQRAIDSVIGQLQHDPAVEGAVLVTRAEFSDLDDDPSSVRRLFATALACYEAAGDQRQAHLQRIRLVDACNRLGAYAEAEGIARDALAAADRMGLGFVVMAAQNNLGFTLMQRGALHEARTMLSAATKRCIAHGDRRFEGGTRTYLANTLRLAGDLAGAEAEVREAIDALHLSPPLLAYAIATLADILLAQGRTPGALEQARAAHTLLESLGQVEEGEAFIRLIYAEALHASGDHAAARAAIAAARDRLLAIAAHIGDETWRRSFLENVPENARTLALAARWLSAPGDG
jgi:tetratricopeptide (TPR) repeat protein